MSAMPVAQGPGDNLPPPAPIMGWKLQRKEFLHAAFKELQRSGDPESVVIDRMLPAADVPPELQAYWIRIGATKDLGDHLHRLRDKAIANAPDKQPSATRRRSGKYQAPDRGFTLRLRQIRRVVADGRMKFLDEFLRDDAVFVRDDARSRKNGAAKDERWADAMVKACDKYRVDEFKHLPKAVQQRIVDLVEA